MSDRSPRPARPRARASSTQMEDVPKPSARRRAAAKAPASEGGVEKDGAVSTSSSDAAPRASARRVSASAGARASAKHAAPATQPAQRASSGTPSTRQPPTEPTPTVRSIEDAAALLFDPRPDTAVQADERLTAEGDLVDGFGLAQDFRSRVQPALDWLYERYFRVRVDGLENLPATGPALLVCNHGGALPWDGVILATAIAREHAQRRTLRWLVEDFAFHAPFIGPTLNRLGAVRACQENAQHLVSEGQLVAVFPEGVKGIGKPYSERYRLQRFGRGGHVKLALRMGVPLIPVGIVGADDTYPVLHKVRAFSKALGLPFIPVTPLFPWLGPLGLLPLPSRWHISIGKPLEGFDAMPKDTADDALAVSDINERVRREVQLLLDRALTARGPHAFRSAHG